MTALAAGAIDVPRRFGDRLGQRLDEPVAATLEWEPSLEDAYRTLAPAVLGYYRSHRLEQAEDLVSDVFVSVARGLRRFRGDQVDLRRWVFAIARRRMIDHHRWRHVRRHTSSGEAPELEVLDDIGALDVDLVDALAQLTELQREVVILRFVGDLPIDDVARIVRRSPGAVKATQLRALNQLAGRLSSA